METEGRSTEISFVETDAGLSPEDRLLLNTPLPHELDSENMVRAWHQYQSVIARLLIRMGRENRILHSIARVPGITSLEGVYARLSLIPKFGRSSLRALEENGWNDFFHRLAGECSLMELSAAAGYRTFCFPNLVKGLLKTGKMRDQPVQRMMDTFDFLITMFQLPPNDHLVLEHLERTNGLHSRYKVAGAAGKEACDLFKYIALNMFYIGPAMRIDLKPQERHAICGLTVLVAGRMGHTMEGTVREFESFIAKYENSHMFLRNDSSELRRRAVEIARASTAALRLIPTISLERILGFVPHGVNEILEIG